MKISRGGARILPEVTRWLLISFGEWGKDGEKNGKGCEGTCIKDTWTNPKVGRIEGGRWAWVGWGRGVGRKWRQLYLNNNKEKYSKRERERERERENCYHKCGEPKIFTDVSLLPGRARLWVFPSSSPVTRQSLPSGFHLTRPRKGPEKVDSDLLTTNHNGKTNGNMWNATWCWNLTFWENKKYDFPLVWSACTKE